MPGTASEPESFERLVEELRARVESRRRDGVYPPNLEDELAAHFDRMVDRVPTPTSADYERLDALVEELERFRYDPARIESTSGTRTNALVQKGVGKLAGRELRGMLEQSQLHAAAVYSVIALLAEIVNSLGNLYHHNVMQQLHDMQARDAERARTSTDVLRRLEAVEAQLSGRRLETFFRRDHLLASWRGSSEQLRDRYTPLAAALDGCAPVLEIGFGRGEFLELLAERGVDAHGIERDDDLVAAARGRGLTVQPGCAVEHLERLDAASLGGIVMIHVLETLPPQHVLDVVQLSADILRPKGRLLIETLNPESLYTYAHGLWLDPEHVRPVHPAFLSFALEEAGFSRIERRDGTSVPVDESLEPVSGSDEVSNQLNANIERLNALLFGPRDYALIATR